MRCDADEAVKMAESTTQRNGRMDELSEIPSSLQNLTSSTQSIGLIVDFLRDELGRRTA